MLPAHFLDKSSDPILLWLGAQKKTDQIPTELTYVVEGTVAIFIQSMEKAPRFY